MIFSHTSGISWRRKFRLSIDIRRLRSSAILSNKVSAESNLYVLSQLKRWNFIDLPRLAIFQQFLLSGSFQCMRLRSLASKLRLQTDSFLFTSTKFICLSRNCHAIISLFIRHFRFFFIEYLAIGYPSFEKPSKVEKWFDTNGDFCPWMEYSNTDILDCLRANLLAVSYVTSCVPFLRGHASEKKSSIIFIWFSSKTLGSCWNLQATSKNVQSYFLLYKL